VKAARFDRILLIDVRVIAADDILHTYWELGSPSPCMGVPEQPPPNRPLEQVFHCLRAAKRTTVIFLDRRDYLGAVPERRDRSINDDTRLFAIVVEKGPIYCDMLR